MRKSLTVFAAVIPCLVFTRFPGFGNTVSICIFCSLNTGCKLLCTASEQLRMNMLIMLKKKNLYPLTYTLGYPTKDTPFLST